MSAKRASASFNSSRGSDARIGAFARQPRKVFGVLFERRGEQRAPCGKREHVCEQRGLFQEILMSARLLFREALEKETGAILIGKIADAEIRDWTS